MKVFFLVNQLSQKFSLNNSSCPNQSRTNNNIFLSKFWLQRKIVKVKMFWISFRNKIKKWKMKVLAQSLKIQKTQLVIMKKVAKRRMAKLPLLQSKKFWKSSNWTHQSRMLKWQKLKNRYQPKQQIRLAISIDKLLRLKKQLRFNKKSQTASLTNKLKKSKRRRNKLNVWRPINKQLQMLLNNKEFMHLLLLRREQDKNRKPL